MVRRPIVLVYHGVGDASDSSDPGRMITPPRHVVSHVRFLRRLGYRFRTAEEVLDAAGGGPPEPGTAVLTFDDGFADWVTVALPLLRDLGIRATFYVCPGWLGGRHPDVPGAEGMLLDEAGVRALAAAGMEVGSHSMVHADLRELDEEPLRADLGSSKAAVEELTGRACRTLAYPYGLFTGREERAAAEAGYELAFAWRPGPWRPLAAPRLPAPPRHGAPRLAAKMLGVRRRA